MLLKKWYLSLVISRALSVRDHHLCIWWEDVGITHTQKKSENKAFRLLKVLQARI